MNTNQQDKLLNIAFIIFLVVLAFGLLGFLKIIYGFHQEAQKVNNKYRVVSIEPLLKRMETLQEKRDEWKEAWYEQAEGWNDQKLVTGKCVQFLTDEQKEEVWLFEEEQYREMSLIK